MTAYSLGGLLVDWRRLARDNNFPVPQRAAGSFVQVELGQALRPRLV